jgi:hypothetical protein
MWWWALGKVPWRTILRHAPTIVEAARGYYATTRQTATERHPTRTMDGPDGLRRAVERLEEREVEQAALVADLAKQVAQMATAIEALRARLVVALWTSALTGALAIVALVLALRGG